MPETVVTIDISTFFMMGIGFINLLVIGPIGWILRGAIRDLRNVENQQAELEKSLPKEYVRQEHYRHDIDQILKKLDAIYVTLNTKADKGG